MAFWNTKVSPEYLPQGSTCASETRGQTYQSLHLLLLQEQRLGRKRPAVPPAFLTEQRFLKTQ